MKNNNRISKLVILFFSLYLIQSVLSIVVIKLFHFRVDVINIVETFDLIVFSICGAVFLVWYYQVSSNFDYLFSKNDALKNLLYWFVPVVNSILVFNHLKIVYKNYSSKCEISNLKYSSKLFNRALNIWLLFFILYYVYAVYITAEMPLDAEDLELYYALNPNTHLYHKLGGIVFDLVGLGCMNYVVKAIMELEGKLYETNREIEISDHLISEE